MTRADFLEAMIKASKEAEALGLLTMVKDTVGSMLEGKPDEAKRRAERGAKAALARKAIREA